MGEDRTQLWEREVEGDGSCNLTRITLFQSTEADT